MTGGFHAPEETSFEAYASHIRALARWHRTVSRPVAGPFRVTPDAEVILPTMSLLIKTSCVAFHSPWEPKP